MAYNTDEIDSNEESINNLYNPNHPDGQAYLNSAKAKLDNHLKLIEQDPYHKVHAHPSNLANTISHYYGIVERQKNFKSNKGNLTPEHLLNIHKLALNHADHHINRIRAQGMRTEGTMNKSQRIRQLFNNNIINEADKKGMTGAAKSLADVAGKAAEGKGPEPTGAEAWKNVPPMGGGEGARNRTLPGQIRIPLSKQLLSRISQRAKGKIASGEPSGEVGRDVRFDVGAHARGGNRAKKMALAGITGKPRTRQDTSTNHARAGLKSLFEALLNELKNRRYPGDLSPVPRKETRPPVPPDELKIHAADIASHMADGATGPEAVAAEMPQIKSSENWHKMMGAGSQKMTDEQLKDHYSYELALQNHAEHLATSTERQDPNHDHGHHIRLGAELGYGPTQVKNHLIHKMTELHNYHVIGMQRGEIPNTPRSQAYAARMINIRNKLSGGPKLRTP